MYTDTPVATLLVNAPHILVALEHKVGTLAISCKHNVILMAIRLLTQHNI